MSADELIGELEAQVVASLAELRVVARGGEFVASLLFRGSAHGGLDRVVAAAPDLLGALRDAFEMAREVGLVRGRS